MADTLWRKFQPWRVYCRWLKVGLWLGLGPDYLLINYLLECFSLQFMISVFFICVVLCCEYVCSGESEPVLRKETILVRPFWKTVQPGQTWFFTRWESAPVWNFSFGHLQSFLALSRCTLLPHTEALKKIHPQVKRKWADLGRFGSMQADAGQIQEFSGDST